jgi:hypothetical protein
MTTRRLFLAAGSASAVFGSLSAAAAPSDLEGLISAHQAAAADFYAAIDAEQAAEAALKDKHPEGFLVPNIFGLKIDGMIFDIDESKEWIIGAFEDRRKSLASIEKLAPGSSGEAYKALAEKQAEALALVDATFEKETGALARAERQLEEASDAEMAAALAICAYRCSTLEEVRRKAEYALSIPLIKDSSGEELTLAFIQSLAEEAKQ